jgi:hypothetical protein
MEARRRAEGRSRDVYGRKKHIVRMTGRARAGPDIFVTRFGTKIEASIPLYFFTIGLLSAICNL